MYERGDYLTKKILEEYIDAVELIRETEEDIRKLERKKKTIIRTNVSGSNPDFPYEPKHFKISGTPMTYREEAQLRYEEKILVERKEKAKQIQLQVQQFLNTAPSRIQRIVRMRYFEGESWQQVADTIGKKATADSVRMELERFLKEK